MGVSSRGWRMNSMGLKLGVGWIGCTSKGMPSRSISVRTGRLGKKKAACAIPSSAGSYGFGSNSEALPHAPARPPIGAASDPARALGACGYRMGHPLCNGSSNIRFTPSLFLIDFCVLFRHDESVRHHLRFFLSPIPKSTHRILSHPFS